MAFDPSIQVPMDETWGLVGLQRRVHPRGCQGWGERDVKHQGGQCSILLWKLGVVFTSKRTLSHEWGLQRHVNEGGEVSSFLIAYVTPSCLSHLSMTSPTEHSPTPPHLKSTGLCSMNGALWCVAVTAANVFTSIWSVYEAANWVSVFPGHQEVSLSTNRESRQKASTDVVSHPLPSRFRPA